MHFRKMVFMFLLSSQGNLFNMLASNFIEACYRYCCLAASWLMIRRYYVIIENSKELCAA